MKSVMQHDFSKTPAISAPRSSFDRSFGYKTTFDAGQLIPFYVDDVLPGDTFNLNTTALARLNTPAFPFMDNMYMDTHFFWIPLRLVWDNARKFFGEQENPSDSIDYTLPVFTSFTPTEASLSDYLGLPPGNPMTPVSLYHRAHNLVWNHWFRDQNLQDSLVVDTDDGPDDIADYVIKKRGKRHDYFTSALPFPQKGDAVLLPLAGQAPVSGIGVTNSAFASVPSSVIETGYNVADYSTDGAKNTDGTDGTIYIKAEYTPAAPSNKSPAIYAELDQAVSATINDWREAVQVQKLLERDARGGTRYSELVNNHFGVNFYDASYRPEFLGGGSTPINSTPVANTSSLGGSTGDLGAFSTATLSGHGFTKSFNEHGIILGFVSVRADLTYQSGIPRRFLKSTRYDIYWPSLAHLGEQEITNAEIYYQNTTDDDLVFGYQERYAEYRYNPSQITAGFRSSALAPLDPWHLSQEFSTLPILGDTFITEDPPVDRIVTTPTEPHFIFDSYTMLRCARPMPIYSVPGMTDHF